MKKRIRIALFAMQWTTGKQYGIHPFPQTESMN